MSGKADWYDRENSKNISEYVFRFNSLLRWSAGQQWFQASQSRWCIWNSTVSKRWFWILRRGKCVQIKALRYAHNASVWNAPYTLFECEAVWEDYFVSVDRIFQAKPLRRIWRYFHKPPARYGQPNTVRHCKGRFAKPDKPHKRVYP